MYDWLTTNRHHRHTADSTPTHSRLTTDAQPTHHRRTANLPPTHSRLTTDAQPTCHRRTADLPPTHSRLTTDAQPTYHRRTADLPPTHSRLTTDAQPTYHRRILYAMKTEEQWPIRRLTVSWLSNNRCDRIWLYLHVVHCFLFYMVVINRSTFFFLFRFSILLFVLYCIFSLLLHADSTWDIWEERGCNKSCNGLKIRTKSIWFSTSLHAL